MSEIAADPFKVFVVAMAVLLVPMTVTAFYLRHKVRQLDKLDREREERERTNPLSEP